jgi:hypothetical protein
MRCSCCDELIFEQEELEAECCFHCIDVMRCHFDKEDPKGELTELNYYLAGIDISEDT